MKILLLGATGQLGGDLIRNNKHHNIDTPPRGEVDLSQPSQTAEYIRASRPEMVINCAAFHDVMLCEEEPERAFRINCLAVWGLAAVCNEIGAWLVTFSSDYVFSGEKRAPYLEEDLPGPLQIYGISRLAGENAAIARAPDRTIVIRTCGLYGITGASSKGGNFVDKCVALARNNSQFDVGCDQTVSPTSTQSLSCAVLSLLDSPQLCPGIYHLVSEGACTWYEFAVAIVDLLGFKTKVYPVDRAGRTGTMRRPIYSALSNKRAQKMGVILPPWRISLANYIQIKYHSNNLC